jgi:hypothetical protein
MTGKYQYFLEPGAVIFPDLKSGIIWFIKVNT